MSSVNPIDVPGLEELRKKGPVTLVDVRTEAEVARGIIAGAKHVPLQTLSARYTELDPQAVTVVYCQSGGRSAQAGAWLAEKGFGQIYNLQGGVLAWVRSGFSLTPFG